MNLRLIFFPCLIALTVFSCKTAAVSASESIPQLPSKPLNIILLIGDGMGISQISTRYYLTEEKSNFSRFKQIGLHKNSSSSHRVTDSAAGATAFSCGVKTFNGAIGVDANGRPVKTILEILAERGYMTGLVSTSSIQHATPASFYAHVPSRGSYEDITKDFVRSDVHFVAGGGKDFFSRRSDHVNYFDSLLMRNYVLDTAGLNIPTTFNSSKSYAYILAPDGMPKMQEGRGDFLPKATRGAMNYLSAGKNGFFLMVEGSQIDWGGHDNDPNYIVEEMKDFDLTIGAALDFAEKDGNTLVIVTADHETGGFALAATTTPEGKGDYGTISMGFTSGHHTAQLIPVFAYGPQAELFQGIYENNEIYFKMMQALGK